MPRKKLQRGMTAGARKLREWRASQEWSQWDLGKEIGRPDAMVSRYENGRQRPDLETLARIRDLTGIPIDAWLLSTVEPDAA